MISAISIRDHSSALDSISPISNVSFPRSGHHLLIDMMRILMGPTLSYCEYYTCCFQTPCSNPATNWQKNHDFDLSLANQPDAKYVIQYRTFLESAISSFVLRLNCQDQPIEENLRKANARYVKVENNRKSWEEYVEVDLQYWKDFINKWVVNNQNKNALFVEYSSLTNDTKNVLKKIVNHFAPGFVIGETGIKDLINLYGVKKRRNIENFEFYDKQFMGWLEDQIKDELVTLGLKKHT